MPYIRLMILVAFALIAFAANSLLCRAALAHTQIDAASFTTARLFSGAIVLSCILWGRNYTLGQRDQRSGYGNWLSALALFAYAGAFSFSYLQLTAAAGALLLFSAVQITMIGYGIFSGERLRSLQWLGLTLASGGLIGLLLPGLSAPPLAGALLMMSAGVAWGIYSLRGKNAGDPLQVTAGNFARAVPMAIMLSTLLSTRFSFDLLGLIYAILSGAIASGMGYAIWYAALPFLKSITAATLQLSVPLIAALGGILFLGEQITLRLFAASVAIISGIALVVLMGKHKESAHYPVKVDVPSSDK